MQQLFEDLRAELCERLQTEDWTTQERLACVPPVPFAAGHLVTFSRSLNDGFIVMATFSWMWEEGSSPLRVVGHVGSEYEPAGALLAALTDPVIMGVVLSGLHVSVEVAGAGDVQGAVGRLGLFVGEQAKTVERVRDVDTVISLLREGCAVPFTDRMVAGLAFDGVQARVMAAEPVDAEDSLAGDKLAEHQESPAAAEAKLAKTELIAVLLTVAGRHDEAHGVLTNYEPPGEEADLARKYGRFVRHFTRFHDAGGELPPPSTPPRWPPSPVRLEPPSRTFSQFLLKKLPEARARQEAVKAVRAVSQRKTREELRTLFEEELDKRGLKLPPSTVETQVGLLSTERESFGKARIALRGLKALGKLAGLQSESAGPVAERAPQESEADTETRPEPDDPQFDLPEHATYPIVGSSRRRAAVGLDPSARAWLDRVAQRGSLGSGPIPGLVLVKTWLTWDTEPSTTQPRLNVHVGTERVGQLSSDIAEQFRPAMEVVAERDEDPWTHAYLSASSGAMPYLLEIALPIYDGADQSENTQ